MARSALSLGLVFLFVAWALGILGCWFYTQQEYPIVPLENSLSDCSWSTQSVDAFNNEKLYPILSQLTKRVFFSYWKVNYWKDCEIWEEDNEECSAEPGQGGCQICPCNSDEIPSTWQCEDELITSLPYKKDTNANDQFWNSKETKIEELWTIHDEDVEYINLQLNPERNTGYGGPHAGKIWRAIYMENCFSGKLEDQCLEERAFFRLVSGIHGSTAVQVAERFTILSQPFLLSGDNSTANRWDFEENLPFYVNHIGKWPDRATNIYFTWSVLLRAFHKAHDFLESYPYNTGNENDDQITSTLIQKLLHEGDCPTAGFNEKSMFSGGQYKDILKNEFKKKFRNVSRIMDCVACQNCRIHGKLSMLGIATALKVLLDQDEVHLQRNEAIALVNTLFKFSESIRFMQSMRERVFYIFLQRIALVSCVGVSFVVLSLVLMFLVNKGKINRRKKANNKAD